MCRHYIMLLCFDYRKTYLSSCMNVKQFIPFKVKSSTGKTDSYESLYTHGIRKECKPHIYLPTVRNARLHRDLYCRDVILKSATTDGQRVS